jgi:hypothetical protein
MKTLLTLLIIGFFLLVFAHWIYVEGTYHYRITVPDGRSSRSYYTDGYKQRGNCVSFQNETEHDSSQVCGMYTITRLK